MERPEQAGKTGHPKEAMRFGKALYGILGFILLGDPNLIPALIYKVDLAYVYMWIWICLD